MSIVGYWWSEKKSGRFNAQELSKILKKHGIEFVMLDLEQDLSKQGPFSAIIHKFSDILIRADSGDDKSLKIIDSLKVRS